MSFRYPAGLITASSPVNANYPSGVWTPRQALPYLQNNVWGQDPFFDQTTLLLHGDGTNGAQNNTFLDSSSNNFTITRNGNTTQGTFSPFSLAAGEWSNYFDGNGDWLQVADNANLELGSSNFTIECWVYITGALGTYDFISKDDSTGRSWALYMSSTQIRTLLLYSDASFDNFDTNFVFTTNQWNHVALTRSGNTFRQFVNGVLIGTLTIGSTKSLNNTSAPVKIGARVYGDGTNYYFPGYISNVRMVIGTALYTAAFTPPTAPLTAVANTQLLTCQSNRFVDNSTNNFAITRNGDVRVTPFSPFQPLLAYSPGVTGGSGYFDGNGDFLTVADNAALRFGTSNFTIEAWIYRTVASSADSICGKGAAGVGFQFKVQANNTVRFSNVATAIDTTATVPINEWVHLAAVREGTGTNQFKIYINGVAVTTATVSSNFNDTNILRIGADRTGGDLLDGYMSDFRYVIGTAVYTADFTPPTAPLTAITNTQLLCNFTNAGILDNTAKNNLETVGNAQIDTAVVKYGTGSMEFDGNGDFLTAPNSENFAFGTGDFTVEGWVNTSSLASEQTIFDSLPLGGIASRTTSFVLVIATDGKLRFYSNNAYSSSTSNSVTTGQWFHFAMVRSSGTIKIYINGIEGLSVANTTNFSNTGCVIGRYADAANGYFNGFIDDLRITKGIARYTANFVPPIARFPNQ